MPYTLNGFGTKYYGNRERGEDGSYITTLWVTALYVPLLPLGSYRILPVGAGTNWVVHSSQRYLVQRVPMCWEQVWRVYMIGAPILFIASGLMWSSIKEDRVKESLRSRLKAAGTEVESARAELDGLQHNCLEPLRSSETHAKPGLASLRADLHDRCGPAIPAADRYLGRISNLQGIIREGLSASTLDENDRSLFATYQNIWNTRSHQGEEMKQILTCLVDLSKDCYQNVLVLFDAMDKEDKQVCTVLASLNEKCD